MYRGWVNNKHHSSWGIPAGSFTLIPAFLLGGKQQTTGVGSLEITHVPTEDGTTVALCRDHMTSRLNNAGIERDTRGFMSETALDTLRSIPSMPSQCSVGNLLKAPPST